MDATGSALWVHIGAGVPSGMYATQTTFSGTLTLFTAFACSCAGPSATRRCSCCTRATCTCDGRPRHGSTVMDTHA
eukprot:5051111-Pyramimonas_sp.AAC.1